MQMDVQNNQLTILTVSLRQYRLSLSLLRSKTSKLHQNFLPLPLLVMAEQRPTSQKRAFAHLPEQDPQEEDECVSLYGPEASLEPPEVGHISRYHVQRLGNKYMKQWRCQLCKRRLMFIPSHGPFQSVPVYQHLPEGTCQEAAKLLPSPPPDWAPPKGLSETTILEKGAKPRTPTPFYPWVNRVKPAPSRSQSSRASSRPRRGAKADPTTEEFEWPADQEMLAAQPSAATPATPPA